MKFGSIFLIKTFPFLGFQIVYSPIRIPTSKSWIATLQSDIITLFFKQDRGKKEQSK